jgi:hypothetical protein
VQARLMHWQTWMMEDLLLHQQRRQQRRRQGAGGRLRRRQVMRGTASIWALVKQMMTAQQMQSDSLQPDLLRGSHDAGRRVDAHEQQHVTPGCFPNAVSLRILTHHGSHRRTHLVFLG